MTIEGKYDKISKKYVAQHIENIIHLYLGIQKFSSSGGPEGRYSK
jgi:hypothetical protein